jgi:hypothetical protein
MKRVLASLSFSFLILGGVLIWLGYKELMRAGMGWRAGAYFLIGGMSFALGLRGVKERHRPGGPDDRSGGEGAG